MNWVFIYDRKGENSKGTHSFIRYLWHACNFQGFGEYEHESGAALLWRKIQPMCEEVNIV